MHNGHDVIVKVGLTADQYVAMAKLAEAADLSQSWFMRSLLVREIRADAMKHIPHPLAHASTNVGRD